MQLVASIFRHVFTQIFEFHNGKSIVAVKLFATLFKPNGLNFEASLSASTNIRIWDEKTNNRVVSFELFKHFIEFSDTVAWFVDVTLSFIDGDQIFILSVSVEFQWKFSVEVPHGDTGRHSAWSILIYAFQVVTSFLTICVDLKQVFITAKLTNLEIRVFVGANNQITGVIVFVNTWFI